MELKFSKNLKYLREQQKLKQSDLASALNTTQRKISYWENAKIEPDLEALCRIADYFDVSTDFLLGRKEY